MANVSHSSTAITDLGDLSLGPASIALAYFYFDFQDQSKQQSSALLRSLLIQLVDSYHGTPAAIESLYKDCNNGSKQPNSMSLLQTLQGLLGLFDHAYIVIDALDECTGRNELGTLLQAVHAWNIPGLHVLAMSRKEHDLECFLSDLITTQYSLQSDFVDGDIRVFLEYQFEHDVQLRKKPAAIKPEIVSAIADGANGM